MKKLVSLILIGFIFSCSENPKLKLKVKGLKKGTVYIETFKDTAYTLLDSMYFYNTEIQEKDLRVEYPTLVRLKLESDKYKSPYVEFFYNNGNVEAESTLKNFITDFEVKGDSLTTDIKDYQKIIKKFNNQKLDLIAEKLNILTKKDTINTIEFIDENLNKLERRKGLFIINFCLNKNDKAYTPLIAYTEINYITKKYIDSIYSNLTDNVKESHFGVLLRKELNK